MMFDPCVLKMVADRLCINDLVAMKHASNDVQLHDVLDERLDDIRRRTVREKKVLKKLINYLTHLSCLVSAHEKIPLVKKMYGYLCGNKWFLQYHPKLSDVVHDKLFDLARHPQFTAHAARYLQKLYGLRGPEHVEGVGFGMRNKRNVFVNFD